MRKPQRTEANYTTPRAMTALKTWTTLTSSFVVSDEVDMKHTDETTTSCFDYVLFDVTTTIGAAGKLVIRIEESVDDTTYAWKMDGVRVWERAFDTSHTGITVGLPAILMEKRYFRVSAKYVDGTGVGTVLVITYGLVTSNSTPQLELVAKPDIGAYTRILKSYAALTAAGAFEEIEISTRDHKFASVVIYYAELIPGAGAGKLLIDVAKIDTHSSVDYGAIDTVIDRSGIAAGGALLSSDMRGEQYELETQALDYAITGATNTGGVTTYTVASHVVRVGQKVTVTGMTPSNMNGNLMTVSAIGATSIGCVTGATTSVFATGGTAQLCESIRLEWDNVCRYDKISIGLAESGTAGSPGYAFMIGKTTRA